MTNQEAFDTAVKGIIAQGALSMTPGGMCKYRGPDGLKCAVGQIIPDEEYDEGMEGFRVEGLVDNHFGASLKGLEIHMLEALQAAHDDAEDVADFVRGALIVAEDEQLNMPPEALAFKQGDPS